MASFRFKNLAITTEKTGSGRFTKTSQPIRNGSYSEIKTSEFEFQFNLKGEIKFIRGLSANWPHPSEYLKRTDGNDWVYYSVGTVLSGHGIKDWLGEYYLPCLPYPSNSIFEFNPFTDMTLLQAFAAWSQLYGSLAELHKNGLNPQIKHFLDLVSGCDETALYNHSKRLHSIIGHRISVLPPDTRHVDYEVIPIMVADGCYYQCRFCCVKSENRFKPRSRENIFRQIQNLKEYYGPDLVNQTALFLGDHDALGAGIDIISMAAEEAARELNLDATSKGTPLLFLFGSVDSLLKAGNDFLEKLNRLPFYTYINIGFESVHEPTLTQIQKPLSVSKIHDAFQKMLQINPDYSNIEITANFLIGKKLPPDHNRAIIELLGGVPNSLSNKGSIYLSPLMGAPNKLEMLKTFFEIKKESQLPVYIYLIQRL